MAPLRRGGDRKLGCDTREGPGEMQSVTAFDMVPVSIAGGCMYICCVDGWVCCEGRGVMAGMATFGP